MKRYTKKEAKEVIEKHKANTSFFGENNTDLFGNHINTRYFLYKLLRERCQMGEAETECIIASLVIAGADIRG